MTSHMRDSARQQDLLRQITNISIASKRRDSTSHHWAEIQDQMTNLILLMLDNRFLIFIKDKTLILGGINLNFIFHYQGIKTKFVLSQNVPFILSTIAALPHSYLR